MSFYNPAPCLVCGMDLDNIRHVPHGLTSDEHAELKRLQRRLVADGLGIEAMSQANRIRLASLEKKG